MTDMGEEPGGHGRDPGHPGGGVSHRVAHTVGWWCWAPVRSRHTGHGQAEEERITVDTTITAGRVLTVEPGTAELADPDGATPRRRSVGGWRS